MTRYLPRYLCAVEVTHGCPHTRPHTHLPSNHTHTHTHAHLDVCLVCIFCVLVNESIFWGWICHQPFTLRQGLWNGVTQCDNLSPIVRCSCVHCPAGLLTREIWWCTCSVILTVECGCLCPGLATDAATPLQLPSVWWQLGTATGLQPDINPGSCQSKEDFSGKGPSCRTDGTKARK